MQKLFSDTRKLDSSCRFAYGLSEELMMENAAGALEKEIRNNAQAGSKIIILCGSGNNGADGYALSRRIRIDYEVKIFQCREPSSKLCILQAERAEKCGLTFSSISEFPLAALSNTSVIVDCIFGSGFHGNFEGEEGEQIVCALNDINSFDCLKIACDVPTGVRSDGTVACQAFCADITVTMGAQKTCLYSDMAKDYTGIIKVANLGVARQLYENSNIEKLETGYLLDESDLKLPFRKKNLVNKGSFGSAYIACGEKCGASLIAAHACFKFGAGLVTLIRPEKDFCKSIIPGFTMDLLMAEEFGPRVNCIAAGMGLGFEDEKAGFYIDYLVAHQEVKAVIDADLLYSPRVKELLEKRGKGIVLTPHPKEFSQLLKICGLGDYSIEECITRRNELTELFCKKFKNVVLFVKGSNPVIGYCDEETGFKLFINTFGSPALAKGGSGDALSGMIASLLTQGEEPLQAAINGSLAHALASRKFKNDFALTPTELIAALGDL